MQSRHRFADKAKLFRDFGVNRISMGVQSLDEKLLDRLGRIHSREMVFKSFDILRRAGFDNLNLDLMFAIPTQTMEIWRATLNEAMAMQSEHLSSYEVIYEDDTPLFAQLKAGEFSVDENLACEMYEELISRATAADFTNTKSPILPATRKSNAPASRTNPTIPIGSIPPRLQTQRELLARRFVLRPWPQRDRLRSRRADEKLVEHAALLRAVGKRKTRHRIQRGTAAAAPRGRNAAFGLRMNAGWPFAEFQRVTDFDLRNEWSAEMDQLAERGWASRDAEKFQLTHQGLRFADSAAEMFLR
jgi:coproporphyrinogen III oxidase-like Fe-S oxidoreductase